LALLKQVALFLCVIGVLGLIYIGATEKKSPIDTAVAAAVSR
jgi:hypothetical protein